MKKLILVPVLLILNFTLCYLILSQILNSIADVMKPSELLFMTILGSIIFISAGASWYLTEYILYL